MKFGQGTELFDQIPSEIFLYQSAPHITGSFFPQISGF